MLQLNFLLLPSLERHLTAHHSTAAYHRHHAKHEACDSDQAPAFVSLIQGGDV